MFAARSRREALGRTQLDVASAIDASQAAVCAWENGQRVPTLGRFLTLITELGGRVVVTFEEGP